MNPPAPAQIELLRQARRASLMKVWATGSRRLSVAEKAEIADLISEPPAEAAASGTPPILTPEPAPAEATAADIARWGELYGTSRRPLYKWIAFGREKHDPCPLDHPARMPLWWAMHMKHRVPEKILAAARQASAEAPSPAAAASESPSPTATLPPPPAGDLFATASLDFAAQVEQMRGEQARIQRQLDDARRGKEVEGQLFIDQPAIESLLRQRLSIQEPLRKAEGDLTDWLKQREILVPRADVRAENNRIATAICGAVMRLVKSVRPQLAGKSDAEQDRIWHTETLACFAALKTAQFSTICADELAAP